MYGPELCFLVKNKTVNLLKCQGEEIQIDGNLYFVISVMYVEDVWALQ